jgi:hypothetical protein
VGITSMLHGEACFKSPLPTCSIETGHWQLDTSQTSHPPPNRRPHSPEDQLSSAQLSSVHLTRGPAHGVLHLLLTQQLCNSICHNTTAVCCYLLACMQ